VFHITIFNFESNIKVTSNTFWFGWQRKITRYGLWMWKSQEIEESYTPYQLHKMMWRSHLLRPTPEYQAGTLTTHPIDPLYITASQLIKIFQHWIYSDKMKNRYEQSNLPPQHDLVLIKYITSYGPVIYGCIYGTFLSGWLSVPRPQLKDM
jgi:hypothetical protein